MPGFSQGLQPLTAIDFHSINSQTAPQGVSDALGDLSKVSTLSYLSREEEVAFAS